MFANIRGSILEGSYDKDHSVFEGTQGDDTSRKATMSTSHEDAYVPLHPKPINPSRFFLGLLQKKVGHHRIFCAGSL